MECIRRGHTSLLSCVSKTATPASTLPTVKEISILKVCGAVFVVNSEIRCDNFKLASATPELGLTGALIGGWARL